MPVREADPAWATYTATRKKVADLYEGRDSALPYIRALPGHKGDTIARFQEGAYFLPVVARSVEAFGGLVFAKTPQRTMPESLEPFLGDITGAGQDIDRFAEQAFDGILLSGAVAVLVELPSAPEGATKGDAEKAGIRPTLQLYTAGAVLAARFTGTGATRKLTHVRLVEAIEEVDLNDEFKLIADLEQVRVLDLDDAGFYRQRVYRLISGQWSQYGEDIEPLKSGQRIDHIPIFFSNPRDGEPTPAKPPVADLAEISVAHLNNSAALEWGLLWTANPTPVFIGLSAEAGDDIKLGSSEGISVAVGGDAKFMEFTGKGLEELRLALDAKRRDAAMMGARMLLESPKQAVTAETARIERAGETSVVTGIANALSDCLTKALAFLAEWAGVGGEIAYWLNTDVNPAGLSPLMLAQLLEAWVKGALTEQELFSLLQVHEIIDPAKTFEEHVEEGPVEAGDEDFEETAEEPPIPAEAA
jgi:hypothetical protein